MQGWRADTAGLREPSFKQAHSSMAPAGHPGGKAGEGGGGLPAQGCVDGRHELRLAAVGGRLHDVPELAHLGVDLRTPQGEGGRGRSAQRPAYEGGKQGPQKKG